MKENKMKSISPRVIPAMRKIFGCGSLRGGWVVAVSLGNKTDSFYVLQILIKCKRRGEISNNHANNWARSRLDLGWWWGRGGGAGNLPWGGWLWIFYTSRTAQSVILVITVGSCVVRYCCHTKPHSTGFTFSYFVRGCIWRMSGGGTGRISINKKLRWVTRYHLAGREIVIKLNVQALSDYEGEFRVW